jgi:hypothetical protein
MRFPDSILAFKIAGKSNLMTAWIITTVIPTRP